MISRENISHKIFMYDNRMVLVSENLKPKEYPSWAGPQALAGPVGPVGSVGKTQEYQILDLRNFMDSGYNIDFNTLCMVHPDIDVRLLQCSIAIHENKILIGGENRAAITIYKIQACNLSI